MKKTTKIPFPFEVKRIWKDIEGYPGYQVSNRGNVRTFNKVSYTNRHGKRKWENRLLKQKTQGRRKKVDLWNEKGHKTFLVHRLVAFAFLGKPKDDALTVNHKDGNPSNNYVENLEWITLSENIRHGFKTGLFPQKKCKLIREDGNVFEYRSLSEASRSIGRNNGYISKGMAVGRSIKGKDGERYILEII